MPFLPHCLTQYNLKQLNEFYKNNEIDVNHTINIDIYEECYIQKNISLLYYAIQEQCSLEIIEFFLQKGSNINYQRKDIGYTPLMQACYYKINPDKLILLLLKYGADVTITDEWDNSILHFVIKKKINNIDILQLLLERDINKLTLNLINNNDDHMTPLLYELKKKQPKYEIIELLIKYGANVNIGYYCSPLYLFAHGIHIFQ